MLGSLLDQDEIEEFMAEADAVTHNNFLLDPVIQVPRYTWVYLICKIKHNNILGPRYFGIARCLLGLIFQIHLFFVCKTNAEQLSLSWNYGSSPSMFRTQLESPGREWENGLRRICANAPSTLTCRTLYGILLLRRWLLDFTRRQILHFASSFSPTCAFPTWNTLHIFKFGISQLNPIENSEISAIEWRVVQN